MGGFDLNGNTQLDSSVDPRPPTQLAFPIANLAAPGEIGGTTPAAASFTTIDASGAVNIDGAVDMDSTLDVAGAVIHQSTLAQNDALTMATDKKILLRDSAIFLNSSVDGQADFDADVEVEITTLTLDINASTLTDISGPATVNGVLTAALGLLETAQSLTANSDSGAGSSITAGVRAAVVGGVTADANDWIVLPAIADVPIGHTIRIACNASSNFELRTPAASNTTINGQDCDGTKEYLCTDTDLVVVTKVTATGWIGVSYTALGAVRAAVVPD